MPSQELHRPLYCADILANALNQADALQAWRTFHVPAPARPLFQAGLANFTPRAVTKVDYHKHNRAPLLLLSGGLDRTVPASVVRENAHRYKTGIVELKNYPDRSHFTVGEPGWEHVLDYAITWVERNLTTSPQPLPD